MRPLWEDRVIGVVGVLGLIGYLTMLGYEYGRQEGYDNRKAEEPRTVQCNPKATDLQECIRTCRARVRIEKVAK